MPEPTPFNIRRVRLVDTRPNAALYAAILRRLDQLADEIDQISELVVTLAVETARERDG